MLLRHNISRLPLNALFTALLVVSVMFTAAGCDEDDAGEEIIATFEPIGISRQPVFSKPGTSGTVAFHFLAPKGFAETLTFTSKVPEQALVTVPLAAQPATLAPNTSFGATLSELVYYKVVAQYVLPTAEQLQMSAGRPFLPLPISAEIKGGDVSRVITATLQVYVDGHPVHSQAEGRALAVAITEPSGTAGTDQELTAKGQVSNGMAVDDGRFTVAWFSSGGKVDNRRAIETKWKSGKDAGAYNLILTARGNNSKEFAMNVAKVAVGSAR